jgi:glycosyltransferase involved in cell wall biosynthesis
MPCREASRRTKCAHHVGGATRNTAVEKSTGNIIFCLDSDDILGSNHLQIIVNEFDLDKYDMVYYDDLMTLDNTFKKFYHRIVEPRWASIGTSSISHKNFKNINNLWSSGYGHDFLTMFKLVSMGVKYKKLNKISEYLVCHYQNCDL